jgi:hypothetical protein
VRPGAHGTSNRVPAFFGGALDRNAASEHDEVGERDLLSVRLRRVERLLKGS